MLRLLDILLTLVHFLIIGFNLFGWIWERTRKWHLALVIITAASWFILGLKYGMGYCPITDWQWHVKSQLGERNLPSSFVAYYAERIAGRKFSDSLINTVVAVSFGTAAVLSIYLNFFNKRHKSATSLHFK